MAKAEVEEKKLSKHELIVRMIKETTSSWSDEMFAPEEKITEKAKLLTVGIEELSFAKGDKTKLANLIALITGENITLEKDDEFEFQPMVAIVLTKVDAKDAKHDYETNTVLVSIGDGTAVDTNGKVGSYIKPSRKIVRPATVDEIA